tara:strand:+ start:296 stop:421 length:126 start_codon:yes stop_codon:yes gene_type:complete
MVKDGIMNLVIGIWEEIKTNIIGDNHVYEEKKRQEEKKEKN